MKDIRGIFFILTLCYGFVGCSKVTNVTDTVNFENEYNLKHKTYNTELLFQIGYMQAVDSLLLIANLNADTICSFYSTHENMKKVYQYGVIGNGPNEFLQPLLTYSCHNTFGLNEVNKQELMILEIKSKEGKFSVNEQKRLKAPYKKRKGELTLSDYYFIRLNDSLFVSQVCGGQDNFFSLLDNSLQPIQRFGESPIQEELTPYASRVRLHGNIAACNGTMCFTPNKIPYLACYRLESNVMKKKWSLYYNKAYYGVKNGDLLFDKEKSFGQVLDLDMDQQYIYLLYLDQLLSEYDYSKTEKSTANKILVFDYEGNAVAILNLDCRLQKVALAKDCHKIYGIAQLPEPTIVEFELPSKF